MSTIDVSIVLPTFNGAAFLANAIESCIGQTFKSFELIIVNDCSSDNTPEIIKQYQTKDARIKIINNDQNLKLPKSLNKGFSEAKGKYFTWISDDNYFSPQAIAELVLQLEKSSSDICYSSYYFINEKGNKLGVFEGQPEELIFKCSPGACFLYKKEVHQYLNGYDESKFRMEDFDFWLRAAGHKMKFSATHQPELYYYRKHSKNLTTELFTQKDKYDKYRKDHFKSFQYFFNTCLNAQLSDELINLHLEIYFNEIEHSGKENYSISEKLIEYVEYLEKIKGLAWETIGFNKEKMQNIISLRAKYIIQLVLNDLIFENKQLKKINPQMVEIYNKPVSWYYKEYEVLPLWYKKIGHLIKILTKNRPLK
jgi:glycosyltransferase involved in cell wall biosynthesis